MLSICIAVGPSEDFQSLKASLESIAKQTIQPVEIVIKTVGNHLADDIRGQELVAPLHQLTLIDGSDLGVYDAFNICVHAAQGQYVMFLGCGDLFADIFAAEDIINYAASHAWPDIIYGIVLLADINGEIVTTFDNECFNGRKMRLPWRNPCHHQGVIYSRNWLISRPFQINIGPVADLVHTYKYRVYENALMLNRPITIFKLGGVSNSENNDSVRSRLDGVYSNCNNFRFSVLWKIMAYLVFYLKSLVSQR
jgi:glycosyltransferase involved in cell wall biosynthesis